MKRIFLIPPVIASLILSGSPAWPAQYAAVNAERDSIRYIVSVPSTALRLTPEIMEANQQVTERLAQLDVKRMPEKEREAWSAYQRANALVLDQQWKQAAEAMADVERTYPRSGWADGARFWYAYSLGKNGTPSEEVFREYEVFLKKYPHSKWTDAARSSLISIGNHLAASGKPEYAEKIRPFTESDKLDIALTALVALQNMGDDSLPDIIKLYHSTADPSMRERIISSLSAIRSPGAVDFLIRIAETDSSVAMRRKALIQLSACMFPSGSMMALQSSLLENQNISISTVEKPTMPSSLSIPGGASLRTSRNQLSEQDRNKISAAIKRIARTDSSDDIRSFAIDLISRTGLNEDDIRFLETIVSIDPNPDIRRNGLVALFRMPENRGIPSVISIAKTNSHLQIRKTAIQFLGSSKDPRARTALIEIAGSAR